MTWPATVFDGCGLNARCVAAAGRMCNAADRVDCERSGQGASARIGAEGDGYQGRVRRYDIVERIKHADDDGRVDELTGDGRRRLHAEGDVRGRRGQDREAIGAYARQA